MSFSSANPDVHRNLVIGDGQCVALVRLACDAPHTSGWRRGVKVRGGDTEPFTAIATFDPDGRYGNHTDGRSHAAILLAEESNGLRVLDQWKTRPTGERVIRFKGGAGPAVDDGDQYFVIEADAAATA
jgi:hypothetical protein